MGPITSTAVKSTHGIFKKYHIPQVAPSATDPMFQYSNHRYPYLIRMMPSEIVIDFGILDFIKHYKWERMGILTSRMDYGKSIPTDMDLAHGVMTVGTREGS